MKGKQPQMIHLIKKYLRTNKYTKKIYKNLYFIKNYKTLQKKKKDIQANGLLLMQKISSALDSIDVQWFFDFGTLLGIVRENQLLKHDMDIDIGVINESEVQQKVKNALIDSGFQLRYKYLLNDNIVEESYTLENIKIDINYYENARSRSICYLFYKEETKEYDTNEFDVVKLTYTQINKTIQRDFHGINIKIPENVELFLEEKYGKTWRIPDKKWKYWEAPSAEHIDATGIQKVY